MDLEAVLSRIDLDAVVAREDPDLVALRVDVDAVASRVDLGALVARIDPDAVAKRLDVDAVVSQVDLVGDRRAARPPPDPALEVIAAIDLAGDRAAVDRLGGVRGGPGIRAESAQADDAAGAHQPAAAAPAAPSSGTAMTSPVRRAGVVTRTLAAILDAAVAAAMAVLVHLAVVAARFAWSPPTFEWPAPSAAVSARSSQWSQRCT